jgi:hypothetical protein
MFGPASGSMAASGTPRFAAIPRVQPVVRRDHHTGIDSP